MALGYIHRKQSINKEIVGHKTTNLIIFLAIISTPSLGHLHLLLMTNFCWLLPANLVVYRPAIFLWEILALLNWFIPTGLTRLSVAVLNRFVPTVLNGGVLAFCYWFIPTFLHQRTRF